MRTTTSLYWLKLSNTLVFITKGEPAEIIPLTRNNNPFYSGSNFNKYITDEHAKIGVKAGLWILIDRWKN